MRSQFVSLQVHQLPTPLREMPKHLSPPAAAFCSKNGEPPSVFPPRLLGLNSATQSLSNSCKTWVMPFARFIFLNITFTIALPFSKASNGSHCLQKESQTSQQFVILHHLTVTYFLKLIFYTKLSRSM